MLFFYGNTSSTTVLRNILDEFWEFTGLRANNGKSCLFMVAIDDTTANSIYRGNLLMKYLGVPLITSKRKKGDCKELTKNISARVVSWNSNNMSYSGRTLLIQFVLNGILNFWSNMFVLPKSVLKDVETIMRRFLWSGSIDSKHGSKVSWDNVCKPKKKKEG